VHLPVTEILDIRATLRAALEAAWEAKVTLEKYRAG